MAKTLRKGRQADPSKDEAILSAARALFTERGYSVSIDEVAAAAKVSKQTIYTRYASKQDLLAAVVQLTAEDLVSPLSIGAAAPAEALLKFGLRFVEVVFDERKLAMQRLLIAEAASFPELAQRYYESGPKFVRDRLAAYISRAAAEGKIDVDDPALAASHFLGLIAGSDHLSRLMGIEQPPSRRPQAERVRIAVGLFLKLYARG